MATARMDVTAFVGKLLEEDDVDLVRAPSLCQTKIELQGWDFGAVPPGGVGPDLRRLVRLRQRLWLRLKGRPTIDDPTYE